MSSEALEYGTEGCDASDRRLVPCEDTETSTALNASSPQDCCRCHHHRGKPWYFWSKLLFLALWAFITLLGLWQFLTKGPWDLAASSSPDAHHCHIAEDFSENVPSCLFPERVTTEKDMLTQNPSKITSKGTDIVQRDGVRLPPRPIQLDHGGGSSGRKSLGGLVSR